MKKSIVFLFFYCLAGCGGSNDSEKTSPQVHSLTATSPQVHLLTTTSSEGGKIEPSSMRIKHGSSGKFTLTASNGYTIAEVKGCQGTLVENIYTVSQVSSSCTIEADFSLKKTIIVPTADILFPVNFSSNNESKITVRGTAASPDGIKSVSVNGVDATLNPIVNNSQRSKVKNTILASEHSLNKSYNWQAVVKLSSSNDTKLVVKAISNNGGVNNKAATATFKREIVPSVFTVDHTNNRLIGRKGYNHLVLYDLNTNSEALITPIYSTTGESISGGFNDLVYAIQHDAAIFSSVLQGTLNIYSVDVSTGELTTLLNYDLELDADEWLNASVKDFSYDNVEDELYINIVYFSTKNYALNKAVVYKYDLVTNVMSIISDNLLLYGSRAANSSIEYTNSGLLFTDSTSFSEFNNRISLLSLNGEQLSPVANLPSFPVYFLDSNQDNTFAYATGYEGIAKVDLNLGQYQVLSLDEQETELNFINLSSVSLDETNNRLLVGDSALDMVIEVDLTTGARSEFINSGIGTGRKMITPREIAISNETNIIYVADTGGDKRKGSIMAVDLLTGNRTVILDLNNARSLTDIVVDDSKQLLYILFKQELVKIDITTRKRTIISNNNIGGGAPISNLSGASLDSENNKILVTDRNNSTLLSIDLTTGKRTIIASGFGHSGYGDSSAVDVEYDSLNKKAFVLSQSLGIVYSVDLDSGTKEVVLDSCITFNNEQGLVANDWILQNMFFEPSSRKLLIAAQDTLLSYDVDNNRCEAPTKNWSVYELFDIVYTPEGQVFASGFNNLKQIDLDSSEQVLISR